MIEKLNKDEEELAESLSDPICLIECLFSDLDNNNLSAFDEEKFSEVRLGQKSMVSYEYCLDYDNMKLTTKQKFKQREGSGNVFCYGARRFGKTMIVESLDLILDLILMEGDNVGFSSYDAIHIEGVLEGVIQAFENHPFLRIFDARIKRNPYLISLRKNGSRVTGINMNLQGDNPGCFDDKTEILTDSGWKFFNDVEIKDKVLSIALDSRKAKYVEIKKIHKYLYNGNLLRLKHRSNEFLVTPNHNLVIEDSNGLKFEEAQNIDKTKPFYVASTFNWDNNVCEDSIILKGIVNGKYKEFKCDIKIWVEFLSWYLAEGWLNEGNSYKSGHYRISIGQKNNILPLENTLNRLGLYIKKKKRKEDKDFFVYIINNKLIYEHLKNEFGSKKTKRIAQYIKDLPKELLELFIKIYFLGDGNKWIGSDDKEVKSLFTSVKKLADDLQEVSCKAGFHTHLRTTITKYKGEDYKVYFIQFLNTKNRKFSGRLLKEVKYEGNVYCVEVEPYHTIFVRRNGSVMASGNSQFFQKHLSKLYIEEASQEIQEVYEKRLDSVSENGCVFRISGMTDFIKYSPPGKIYYDQNNQPWIVNYPQFVNPKWDEREKEKAIKEHGGESSISYRMFVKGEIVEDKNSAIDMERVRANYNENKIIKNFEITKENLFDFQNIIIIERPKNAEVIYIAADIGEVASSEIIIISKVNETYHYLYNITLYNLTDKEQFNIFKYIIWQMEANYIALDTTDGTGRSIYRSLEEIFPKESMCWVGFNEKIQIDVLRDDQGNVIMKDGNIVYKEEMVAAWSVKRLKELLYEKGKVNLPIDHKLDTQLNSVISIQSGNKTLYECISKSNGDHLFAAWRVFAIAEWKNYMTTTNSIKRKTFSKIGC